MPPKSATKVVIVESQPELATIWARHLERQGCCVTVTQTEAQAVSFLQTEACDVLILNLDLTEGSSLAIADFASFRLPDIQVIFVTGGSFFSDGSIFNICANARALIQTDTAPEDIAAMVEHFGRSSGQSSERAAEDAPKAVSQLS